MSNTQLFLLVAIIYFAPTLPKPIGMLLGAVMLIFAVVAGFQGA